MIRIFAPPTHDQVFRRDGLTAANLLLHIAAFLGLFVPFGGGEKKESLIDRLIVYLVPPQTPGLRVVGDLVAPVSDVGPAAAVHARGERSEGATERITSGKLLPALESKDLKVAEQTLPGDNALTVLEVDSAVVYDPTSAAPEYPAHLMLQGIEGYASVRYVVDTTGLVDTTTYRVIAATHGDFAVSVRRALPAMHFRPALQSGQRVRQLVEQTFRFKIAPPDSTARPPAPKPPA